MKLMLEALQCCLQVTDYSDIDLSLDLTIDRTYAIPSIPTTRIVIAPYAFSSAPFQEDTSIKVPSPFVETYQTKYAYNRESVDASKVPPFLSLSLK